MSLFDPKTGRFIESNEAALQQIGVPGKGSGFSTAEISPERQPDGRSSVEKAAEMVAIALSKGSHRFEWVVRRGDGNELPLDIVLTRIPFDDRTLLLVVSRDISKQKSAEQEILRLNVLLEQRVAERTIELVQTNRSLREETTERRRQEKNERRRREQMQSHRDVLLELVQARHPDFMAALEAICSRAAATLEVERVSYWSLEGNDSAIICQLLYRREIQGADAGFSGTGLAAVDAPAYFAALATKRPIAASEVLSHPATAALGESYLKPLGITSMLDGPVWVRGQVVGVLCHEHTGPAREWTAEEVDFASSVAVMVSRALEEAQRAESERMLRESERKFRALFEGTSQQVLLHDEHGILEANPSWFQHLGYSELEVVGRHPAEFSAPIQPSGERADVLARKHIADAIANGSTRFEWMILHRDGREIPIEIFLTCIPFAGRPLLQAVCNDISERKQAEMKLRESEARLRESEGRFSAAVRASPVFITISRMEDGRYVLANEAFLNWTDYRLEEVLGRDSLELALWADPADRAPFWEELRRTGSIRQRECRVRNRHGKICTVLLSADIIEINRVPHLLTVGLDISQRKMAEAELLKTLAREKELGQLRTNFVSMVSHEFRTPLGIIQSSAEILDDYIESLDPRERKSHLQSIQKNTRRMASLMEEVLLIGGFYAGKMEFKPGSLDLVEFTRRLVADVVSVTEGRCPIQLDLGELPRQAYADERLLRHILTNLLTNAVKYSAAGEIVQFQVVREALDAVCVIRDRGIGIPEADREWLFSAFHRGQNVGNRPGTGLGLVIVKHCADAHGGQIHVDSATGVGTTMTVRLPVFTRESIGNFDRRNTALTANAI